MMLAGFRLLSDEFGVLDPDDGTLLPMLKPIALKNGRSRSSATPRRRPSWGQLSTALARDVAHLAPDRNSVARMAVRAHPSLIIFPRYRSGARFQELSLSCVKSRLRDWPSTVSTIRSSGQCPSMRWPISPGDARHTS